MAPLDSLAALSDLIPEGTDRFGSDPPLTRDTTTGLRWLDVDMTTGLSFNQMELELLSGGAFSGFRHATGAEVLGLWQTAGIVDIDAGATTANVVAARGLTTLMGITDTTRDCVNCPIATDTIFALTSDVVQIGATSFLRAPKLNVFLNDNSAEALFSDNNALQTATFASNAVGHYLVEIPNIPAPATAIACIVAGAMAGCGRRRRG